MEPRLRLKTFRPVLSDRCSVLSASNVGVLWPKSEGLLCLCLWEEAGYLAMQRNVAWANAYFRTKWHPDPSSCLATIDMGRESGACCAPFRGGELGPHLTQCRLGRGLPPYQVAS